MSDEFHKIAAAIVPPVLEAFFSADEPMFLDDCLELGAFVETAAEAADKEWLDIELNDLVVTQSFFSDMLEVAMKREAPIIHSLNNGDLIDAAKIIRSCSHVLLVAEELTPEDMPKYRLLFEAPMRAKYHQTHQMMIELEQDDQHISVDEALAYKAIGDAVLEHFPVQASMTPTAHELNAARIMRYAGADAIGRELDKAERVFGEKRRTHLMRAIDVIDGLTDVAFVDNDHRLVELFERVASYGRREEVYVKNPVARMIGGIEHAMAYKMWPY